MKKSSSIKSISFEYFYLRDGVGIGAHPMGVFLPVYAQFLSISWTTFSDLTSAGAAVVNIGTTVTGVNTIVNNSQGTAADYTDYNWGTFGFYNAGSASDINTTPSPQNYNRTLGSGGDIGEITFNIDIAPLIFGQIIFTLQYIEFPFPLFIP